MALNQRIGVFHGNDFDLDATFGRKHEEMLLRAAVERVGGVVLLGNVGGVRHKQAMDDMALDVHVEDVPGMETNLIGIFRELDTSGLATAANLYLGLDDDGITGRLGHLDGGLDVVGDATGRDREPEPGELGTALVLEQVQRKTPR